METLEFLDCLYGDIVSESNRILVWTLQDKYSHFFHDKLSAASAAQELSGQKDVYFGVGLSPKSFGTKNRCPASQISAIPGVWADFDIRGDGHKKKNLPPSIDSVLELLQKANLPPTVSINSGNGLHCYWLFAEPFVFKTDSDRELGAMLARRWNNSLRLIAKSRCWDMDATHDLARVMRLPGTFNLKGEPKPVTVTAVNEAARYTIDEVIERFIDDDSNFQPKVFVGADYRTIEVGDITLDPAASPDHDAFDMLCEVEPKFEASWRRTRRDLQDQSASSYDMSLAVFAVMANWSDQEIVNLIIASRRKHKDDLKLRPDYYRGTIAKSRAFHLREQAQESLEEIALSGGINGNTPRNDENDRETASTSPSDDDAPEPAERRRKVLESLSSIFSIKIKRIIKWLSDPPEYRLETDRGAITLGSVNNLIKQDLLRCKLADAAGTIIPQFKANRWNIISQSLLDACEEEDMGAESTDIGMITSWVNQYLDEFTPGERNDSLIANQLPFSDGESIFIFGPHIRDWLYKKFAERETHKGLGAKLRLYGASPDSINCGTGDKHTTRSVWKLPI